MPMRVVMESRWSTKAEMPSVPSIPIHAADRMISKKGVLAFIWVCQEVLDENVVQRG
ncbi:MAG TPA: hypothetical protein VFW84_12650 [Aquabacterium sp.]|uniref:hypothetical protein n=1 Tax=Aquabacterium sp. TaxID=1872578 RepID=UPI002E2F5960|nr:hypothetical protein [Aquabacterium sp.]HEX5373573.1 hypothetical protein [Aquabacterium sp.]